MVKASGAKNLDFCDEISLCKSYTVCRLLRWSGSLLSSRSLCDIGAWSLVITSLPIDLFVPQSSFVLGSNFRQSSCSCLFRQDSHTRSFPFALFTDGCNIFIVIEVIFDLHCGVMSRYADFGVLCRWVIFRELVLSEYSEFRHQSSTQVVGLWV